ncbi:MAG: hypothetical protein V3S25_00395 [Nitrospirales bacterium]
MEYVLAAISGIWIADGLSLLVAPKQVIARVREVVELSPRILKWEAFASLLGLILLLGTKDLSYHLLWLIIGASMVLKGLFLAWGPEPLRDRVLTWCLQRDDIDYRFWGLGLCMLAILLLHALEWFTPR